jgi:hypothetical protein
MSSYYINNGQVKIVDEEKAVNFFKKLLELNGIINYMSDKISCAYWIVYHNVNYDHKKMIKGLKRYYSEIMNKQNYKIQRITKKEMLNVFNSCFNYGTSNKLPLYDYSDL